MNRVSDRSDDGGSRISRAGEATSTSAAWARLRRRYEGSVLHDLITGLGDVEFGDQIILANLVIVTAFFWWGLHFLLGGREPWRRLFPAALATGVFWVGLGAIASLFFASALVSDSHVYGEIGVVFTLVTWFVAMGAVITLGAVVGHLVLERRGPLPAGQYHRPVA